MLLSAVSVLVVAQSSSEIPEELMNNPVYLLRTRKLFTKDGWLGSACRPGLYSLNRVNRHIDFLETK